MLLLFTLHVLTYTMYPWWTLWKISVSHFDVRSFASKMYMTAPLISKRIVLKVFWESASQVIVLSLAQAFLSFFFFFLFNFIVNWIFVNKGIEIMMSKINKGRSVDRKVGPEVCQVAVKIQAWDKEDEMVINYMSWKRSEESSRSRSGRGIILEAM